MNRAPACIVAALVVFAGLLHERPVDVSASQPAATYAKKVCKTVKRAGKKQKVCTTVKSKPKPTASKPKPTATPLPSDVAAAQLAGAVTAATTDDARHSALVSIFKAIDIGVYDENTGAPVVRGMEVSDKDFYLYDGELGGLVSALGRGQMADMDSLAAIFSDVGIRPDGQAVDPTALAYLLQGYVRWAQANKTKLEALLPLLVEDLGQKRSPAVDLATTSTPEQYPLDALQMQLLAIAFLAPLVHQGANTGNAAAFHPMYGTCTPIKIALNPFNPNSYLPDDSQLSMLVDQVSAAVGLQKVQDLVKTFSSEEAEIVGKTANYLALIGIITNMLHGMLLAAGLEVVSGPITQQSTHYGPVGHTPDAGTPLKFMAKVSMFFKLPTALRTCLHDAGVDVPDQGPVPGVPIDWDNGSYLSIGQNHLDDYGTVSVSPADGKTGPDGVSTLTFTPKTEVIPDMGQVVEVEGHERPRALWGMAFGNPLGVPSEVLFPIAGATMDWTVGYHKPRGFKVSFMFQTMQHEQDCGVNCGYVHRDDSVSVRMCGSDPYSRQWDGTEDETINRSGDVETKDGQTAWIDLANNSSTTHSHFFDDAADYFYVSAQILPVSPPQLELTFHDVSGVNDGNDFTVTAPIEEDTSCPDNSGSP